MSGLKAVKQERKRERERQTERHIEIERPIEMSRDRVQAGRQLSLTIPNELLVVKRRPAPLTAEMNRNQ